ncbi:hypothetical protein F4859DRAFT_525407 [Xylaria cf. heliscus]|nr:hypothetical protein F4859DRAFT_525407 [Xylaria cf. heliscus]
MEVENLIPQMQDTLSEIIVTVNRLSTKAQDDELDQLEQKRERLLADLHTSFEKEGQELETKRQIKLENIRKKRKQEDEDRAARRRQEDQELEKANSDEDIHRQKKYDSEAGTIEDETEQKLDDVEKAARKTIQEGKQKLRDLDDKRRELNRRIDEQLKQPLPSAPSRNRNRPKKEPSDTQRNGAVGGSNSVMPRNANSSPKANQSTDTSSTPQPPSATDTPAKSPETRKDGELPFQERLNGSPQGSKDYFANLPRSLTATLRNNVSNGSKGKPELGKPSLNDLLQTEDKRSERCIDMANIGECEKLGAEIIATMPTSMEDLTARGSGSMTPTGVQVTTRENKLVENAELFSETISQVDNVIGDAGLSHRNPSTVHPARRNHIPVKLNNMDSSKPQQNQSCSRSELGEDHRPAVSNVDLMRITSSQRSNDQLHIRVADNVDTERPSESIPEIERLEVSEDIGGDGCTLERANEEADTVVDSTCTFQHSGLSTTSKMRGPRRQDKGTYNKMGPKQPATSDTLEQEHPRDSRNSSDALRCLYTLGQSSQVPVKAILSASQLFRAGEPILSFGTNVSNLSTDSRRSVALDKTQDIKTIGTQSWERLVSPLPVENETVHGQDQLFDDNKSPSDPHDPQSGNGYSDLLSYVPIQSQCLPVLMRPDIKDTLDDQGLTELIGSSGSRAILNGEANNGCSRRLPSKVPSTQDVGGFNKFDTKFQAGRNGSKNDPGPKVIISQQPTRQDSLPPITPSSPNHLALRERDHSRFRHNSSSHGTESFDDRGPSYSHSAPMNMLYSAAFEGQASPSSGNRGSAAYNVTTIDLTKPKDRGRGDSVEPRPNLSKHRGRQRKKSFGSPERALNPRELLFQASQGDINIRSASFKRSKRGLS